MRHNGRHQNECVLRQSATTTERGGPPPKEGLRASAKGRVSNRGDGYPECVGYPLPLWCVTLRRLFSQRVLFGVSSSHAEPRLKAAHGTARATMANELVPEGACPTCGLLWVQHVVWRDAKQVIWSPTSWFWFWSHQRSGTPACELKNGHLGHILDMLTRWIDTGDVQHRDMRDALILEAERRGWADRWTIPQLPAAGPAPSSGIACIVHGSQCAWERCLGRRGCDSDRTGANPQ